VGVRQLTCKNCGRILGKINDDGTIHVRHASSGFEFIGSFSRVMFVCPKNYFNRSGKVICGQVTLFDNTSQQDPSTAREKIKMDC
jgi:peptidyl-tRNA hydrolase